MNTVWQLLNQEDSGGLAEGGAHFISEEVVQQWARTTTGAGVVAGLVWWFAAVFTRALAGQPRRRLVVGNLLWLVFFTSAYGQVISPGQVTLAWNASTDPTVVGYRLYYGVGRDIYTNKISTGTNTTLVVTGLVAGSTYYFAATTYNKMARESSFSSAISYRVPLPAISNTLSASALNYGQPLSASTITGTVTNFGGTVIPGKFAFATPSAIIPAGTHAEPAVFTATTTTDFKSLPVNVSVTVKPVPLTITALNRSKTYGQTVAFGSGSTNFTAAGLPSGQTMGTVTLNVSNNGGAAPASVAGSPYLITPSAATGGTFAAGNYVITYVPGTLTVTRATLTVTANHQSRSYGAANPVLTASYSGLAGKDTTAVIHGVPVLTTSATNSSPVGNYVIMTALGTLMVTNYALTVVNGTLSVTQASLTITALNQSKTFGQIVAFGSGSKLFTASGLQNGQTIGTITRAVAHEGGTAPATVAGSPYTITPSAATGGTFAPGNYAITYVPGKLTVIPLGFLASVAGFVSIAPVKIENIVRLGNGSVQLTLTGGQAGTACEVQGSPDLRHWTTLASKVAGPDGWPACIDTGASSNAWRFYRTVTP